MSTVSPGLGYPAASVPRRPLDLSGAAAAVLRLVLLAAAGFGLTIAAAVTVTAPFGFTSLDELSGSMAPVIKPGDEVITRRIRPLDARIGDVVSFRNPDGRLITHRVVSMRVYGANVLFVTRGDANTGEERWQVPLDGRIGRVVDRIPKLGYLTNRTGSKIGRVALIVLPVLLLGLYELRRIWLPAGGRR